VLGNGNSELSCGWCEKTGGKNLGSISAEIRGGADGIIVTTGMLLREIARAIGSID